jgi:hypothetical protein
MVIICGLENSQWKHGRLVVRGKGPERKIVLHNRRRDFDRMVGEKVRDTVDGLNGLSYLVWKVRHLSERCRNLRL